LLYGVTPTSARVFALAGGLLGLIALLATVGPARRAGHTNPIDVILN